MAFAEPSDSPLASATDRLGALIQDDTVVSATNAARAAAVRPGMRLRVAGAFAPKLSFLRAGEPHLPSRLTALHGRLAPFVTDMRAAQDLFEPDSVLLTAKCQSEDRIRIQKAAFSPLTPKALQIGFGATQTDAIISVLARQPLTLEAAVQMHITDILSVSLPVSDESDLTLGRLLADQHAADYPALSALRRLLRGDSDVLKPLLSDNTFSLRTTFASCASDTLLEAHIRDAALTLNGLLRARNIQPGCVTLALETADGTVCINCDSDSAKANDIASQLICRLRKTPHEAVTALMLSAKTQCTHQESQALPGLAADLIARLGSGRVFRLSETDNEFSGQNRHVSGHCTRRSEPLLPVTEAVPALIRREAVLLEDEDGLPVWESRLTLLDGPTYHRVGNETREYRTAATTAGRRVWIWRTPGKTNWHLQGFF